MFKNTHHDKDEKSELEDFGEKKLWKNSFLVSCRYIICYFIRCKEESDSFLLTDEMLQHAIIFVIVYSELTHAPGVIFFLGNIKV